MSRACSGVGSSPGRRGAIRPVESRTWLVFQPRPGSLRWAQFHRDQSLVLVGAGQVPPPEANGYLCLGRLNVFGFKLQDRLGCWWPIIGGGRRAVEGWGGTPFLSSAPAACGPFVVFPFPGFISSCGSLLPSVPEALRALVPQLTRQEPCPLLAPPPPPPDQGTAARLKGRAGPAGLPAAPSPGRQDSAGLRDIHTPIPWRDPGPRGSPERPCACPQLCPSGPGEEPRAAPSPGAGALFLPSGPLWSPSAAPCSLSRRPAPPSLATLHPVGWLCWAEEVWSWGGAGHLGEGSAWGPRP